MRDLRGITRDFFGFYLPRMLTARFRPTPLLDRLPTVDVVRGQRIGGGAEKLVFAGNLVDPQRHNTRPVVILQRRRVWPVEMAEEELRGLDWFQRHGFPVAEVIGKTAGPRPALVQERFACGAKEVNAKFLRGDDQALLKTPLNRKTERMLEEMIAKLRTLRHTLPDLQVLIARDGGIAINDVVSPRPSTARATDFDLRGLLTLLEATRHTIHLKQQALETTGT